ncbi:ATP-grasp domain-containing protein [Chryseobacterium takakiae]|uniref:ATP-GRASP peptide maturase, grasp-with-spasm system n=1 Tax=Chryseobacterium takakiae TaxID=1302685 RepID=A0A1M4WKY3_9FLAO|nr:hypothetical protein [Chryseobacterium takakiae]SHE81971.1 hypothetical protein SAMN05444408_104241 [Chryseobacterium takakiae]
MIKIISQETDKSTDNIIKWLLFYDQEFRRYNVEDFTEFSFRLGDDLSDFNFLHRRARLTTFFNTGSKSLDTYIREETNMIIKAWERIIKTDNKASYIGEFHEEEQHNKLLDLHIANSIGLLIPKTVVTNSKKELNAFADKYPIITKAIKTPVSINDKDFSVQDKGTMFVKREDIDDLDNYFSLSIFQEYIQKDFEIRAFVYENMIFPMAIFSQNDTQTKTDYRNYNTKKPNRCVPFKFPKDIENKIFEFFKIKKINTGSVDLIKNNDNFYFLENNPQGQYEWLSENCNYYIDKFIAKNLMNMENGRK